MDPTHILAALAAGMITGAVTSLIVDAVARLAKGNQISLLEDLAPPSTSTPTASICPRCGSPIDTTTHTTRHYETNTPPKFKWSEVYCGEAPDLKQRWAKS